MLALSLACSRLQYSTSNTSASGSGSKRPMASASVMTSNGVAGEIGGDGRIPGRGADTEQAEPRHKHDARHRIELALAAADAAVLALEHGVIGADIVRHRRAQGWREGVELACLRQRRDQRPVFGADDVVGRHHAALAVVGQVGAIDIVQHLAARSEVEHEALAARRPCRSAARQWHRGRWVPLRQRLPSPPRLPPRTHCGVPSPAAPRPATPSRSCARRLPGRSPRR